MSLESLICRLTMDGFTLRLEKHPVNPKYIAVKMSLGKFSQRATIKYTDANPCFTDLLVEMSERLKLFHKVRKN